MKTEKFDDEDGESLDAIIIKDEPEDVDIKFETYPAMPNNQPFQPGQQFGQPLPTGSFISQSPAFMGSPGQQGSAASLGTGQWTPGTPGSQPPGGPMGTPDTPGSVSFLTLYGYL